MFISTRIYVRRRREVRPGIDLRIPYFFLSFLSFSPFIICLKILIFICVQIYTAATLSFFSAGIANGWNSPSIPILTAVDSPIPMTADQGSWLIQVAVLGLLVTSYPASWMTDQYLFLTISYTYTL